MNTLEDIQTNLSSADWSKRRDAVFFLAQQDAGADYLDLFVRMLSDPHWEVRVEAAHAIGKFPDPERQFDLVRLLEDEHDTVRRVAAKVIGVVGDSRSVEALKRALDDQNSYVRKNSARALLNIWEREK